jgi:hypothetical protein
MPGFLRLPIAKTAEAVANLRGLAARVQQELSPTAQPWPECQRQPQQVPPARPGVLVVVSVRNGLGLACEARVGQQK